MIIDEITKNSPSSIIDLFEADFSSIDTTDTSVLRFFNDTNELGTNIVFNNLEYTSYPFSIDGFEWDGSGQLPSPKMKLGNINGYITALNQQYQDLLGLRITRIRTLYKYLDAVNFSSGINSEADPTAIYPKEVYYIDRKVSENNSIVEYSLVSALDISSVKIPRRLIIQNLCSWRYKDANCGYIPGAMFTETGIPTDNPILDTCGKRLSDCKLRFGTNNVLNYGGYPGAGLFS